MISLPNECDLLEIERLILPSPATALVQQIGNLPVAVEIEQTVDLADYLRLGLAKLRDRHGTCEHQSARRTAAQANMDGDGLGLDQRHVLDQQAQHAFAFARAQR